MIWQDVLGNIVTLGIGWFIGRRRENSDVNSQDQKTWSERFDNQDRIINKLQQQNESLHEDIIKLQKAYYDLYLVAINNGWRLPVKSASDADTIQTAGQHFQGNSYNDASRASDTRAGRQTERRRRRQRTDNGTGSASRNGSAKE